MFLNKNHIQETLKRKILPSLVTYIKKNLYTVENNAFRGEFYTLIRRHLNYLTNPSSFNITIQNIEHIGVSYEGEITAIGFKLDVYNERVSANKREACTLLNDILKDMKFSFNDFPIEERLDTIINSINLTTINSYEQFRNKH